MLGLVDAVIWVVDPEKYADAVLHERYLRPLAGHAEVTFVVLNQVDRLPAEAADLVLDDLRRLLDEDGMPLGEHGEPGATVLALSALSGEGVGELREMLGEFVGERRAAARRLAADIDLVAERLRPLYAAGRTPGSARTPESPSPTGSPKPSAPRPPARRRNAPGAATPTAPAAPRGCGCGAGTRSAAPPSSPAPPPSRRASRNRSRANGSNRPCAPWARRPRAACPNHGASRSARRRYVARRAFRARSTPSPNAPRAPPRGPRDPAGGRSPSRPRCS